MPAAGVEPARPRGHKILSLARLPIPSRRLIDSQHRNFIKYRDDIQVIFCRHREQLTSPRTCELHKIIISTFFIKAFSSLPDDGLMEGLLTLLDLNARFELFLADAVVDGSNLLTVHAHASLLDKTTAFASRRDE